MPCKGEGEPRGDRERALLMATQTPQLCAPFRKATCGRSPLQRGNTAYDSSVRSQEGKRDLQLDSPRGQESELKSQLHRPRRGGSC